MNAYIFQLCLKMNSTNIVKAYLYAYQNVPRTLRKLHFYFLAHRMGYDRGDSFPFDFEANGISFG